jgi:transposase-like protein
MPIVWHPITKEKKWPNWKIIYTTNAIEPMNRSLRNIIKNRGAFPSDEAATKLIYLALRNIAKRWGHDLSRTGRQRSIAS